MAALIRLIRVQVVDRLNDEYHVHLHLNDIWRPLFHVSHVES